MKLSNSFCKGFGKAINLGVGQSRSCEGQSGYKKDRANIMQDWKNVGKDIRKSADEYRIAR